MQYPLLRSPASIQTMNARPSTLGKVVRARRQELGLTQEALAELLGEKVGQNYISQLERGKVQLPRRPRLELIARALDLALSELLARSGWADLTDYLRDTESSDVDRIAMVGPRAELAALLPKLSMRDVERMLSHANYLLQQEGGDQRRPPGVAREEA